MATTQHILPYIPPRTSSHRRVSSTSNHLPDDSIPTITTTDPGPSSPPRNRMSGTATTTSLYGGSAGKLPAGAGATRFPFRAKSAYFSSSHTEFQASLTSASPGASRPSSAIAATRVGADPKSVVDSEVKAATGRAPEEPAQNFGDKFIDEKAPVWSAEKERILLGPFDYLYGHPGKDIRAQLIAAFNVWLKVPEESLAIITKVVGMLHTASLLYDSHPSPS